MVKMGMTIIKQACTGKSPWLVCTFLGAVAAVILSCSQDPIFYNIHMEAPPRTPVILGSPQNMVLAHNAVYAWTVPGGNIWVFDESSGWNWKKLPAPDDGSPVPNGSIRGLAAADFGEGGGGLLVLVNQGGHISSSSQVWGYIADLTGKKHWLKLYETTDFILHRLFAAGEGLFAGGQRKANLNEYVILSFNAELVTATINTVIIAVSAEIILEGNLNINLVGAVAADTDDTVLLATERNGIYKVFLDEETEPEQFTPASGFVVNGIVKTGGDIVVTGNSNVRGILHILEDNASYEEWPAPLLERGDLLFNGGMGVWQHSTEAGWKPSLLLLGIRSNGSTLNGYRELALNEDGSILRNSNSSLSLNRPGEPGLTSSVASRDRYRESIETRSVHHIMQVPNLGGTFYPANNKNWQPPIFAGTAQHGLFAYDFRNDRWSADDNSVAWEQ